MATFIDRMKLGAACHQGLVMGHRFTADDALKYGIAKAACPGHLLMSRAQQLAQSLVARQPYSREYLRGMKSRVYSAVAEAAERDRASSNQGSVFALKSKV